jgi:hypothetical protein
VSALSGDAEKMEERLWKIYSTRNNIWALKVKEPMTFADFLSAIDRFPAVDDAAKDKCR